jgi:hypothetical protein
MTHLKIPIVFSNSIHRLVRVCNVDCYLTRYECVSLSVHSMRVPRFTSDTLHSSDVNQESPADKHPHFLLLVLKPLALLTLRIKRLAVISIPARAHKWEGAVITQDSHFVWQISFVTSCRLAYRIDLALSVDCQHARRRSGDSTFVG